MVLQSALVEESDPAKEKEKGSKVHCTQIRGKDDVALSC